MGAFGTKTRKITDLYEKRLRAVAKLSIENLVSKAETTYNEPGGRMPIDTGFMRASGGAGLDSMPRGPGQGVKGRKYRGNEELTGMPLPVALARWNFRQKIYYGWSAVYSRHMEDRFKFLHGASQLWPRIVKKATREVRRRGL